LRPTLASIVTLLAAAAATPAAGETAKGREVVRELGGTPVSCRDAYGQNVHAVLVANLGDVGRARNLFKTPVIMLDPGHLNPLPAKLQLFFFGHECAHHVLGHTYVFRPTAESEADCWAAKDGRDRGLFTRFDVENWAPWFAKSRGNAASGHLPGPERVKFILGCFDDEGDRVPSALTSRD
jgi:hypothetical protein